MKDKFSFLPKVRGFKMALLNVVSLPKHLEELRILLREQQFDLLAINETRLDSTIPSAAMHINGFELIWTDRARTGGGVSIY